MEIRVLKLGTECLDKATGLKGTLTHWIFDMSQRVDYIFQPKGLDEEGMPINRIIICEQRLQVTDSDWEEISIPFDILGTEVTDKASGFKGMAVEFVRHINGCFHVAIQPKGTLKKTNKPIKKLEFDLRGCTGKKITELSKDEFEKSKQEKPSPCGTVGHLKTLPQ